MIYGLFDCRSALIVSAVAEAGREDGVSSSGKVVLVILRVTEVAGAAGVRTASS